MCQANKDNPDIQEMIAIRGCPSAPRDIARPLRRAGIEVEASHIEAFDTCPGMFVRRHENRAEFQESFFRID